MTLLIHVCILVDEFIGVCFNKSSHPAPHPPCMCMASVWTLLTWMDGFLFLLNPKTHMK